MFFQNAHAATASASIEQVPIVYRRMPSVCTPKMNAPTTPEECLLGTMYSSVPHHQQCPVESNSSSVEFTPSSNSRITQRRTTKECIRRIELNHETEMQKQQAPPTSQGSPGSHMPQANTSPPPSVSLHVCSTSSGDSLQERNESNRRVTPAVRFTGNSLVTASRRFR